jgi:hypothetical protein
MVGACSPIELCSVNSVVEVNEFSLTQSVDIDLCHLVTANVMELWGSMD